ncbi:hypothetical protein [Desulfallas thermosapovorans]|uniref:hypothetical protein n=1 Tax=Desulfallas thermosapovorans TaxID=58137 RepID=UPI0014121D2C|nr:hypothetical protein [Desulfallas thermosapovorans]
MQGRYPAGAVDKPNGAGCLPVESFNFEPAGTRHQSKKGTRVKSQTFRPVR